MTKSRGILGPRHVWTKAEHDTLRRLYPEYHADVVAKVMGLRRAQVHQKAAQLKVGKSQAFLEMDKAMHRKVALTDPRLIATRLKPGNKPWNTGKHFVAGGRSGETRFKPGQPCSTAMGVGALRINADGMLDIKVAEGKNQWMTLRRYVWETEVGPVPPGMCVNVRNGDRDDCRLENLVLLTRAENIKHNLHLKYPKPLLRVMKLQGRINNRITALEGTDHE